MSDLEVHRYHVAGFDAALRSGHYRDVLLQVRVRAGGWRHLAELQIHAAPFLRVKQASGHGSYEIARALHAGDEAIVKHRGDPSKWALRRVHNHPEHCA